MMLRSKSIQFLRGVRAFHPTPVALSQFAQTNLADPSLFKERAFINGHWVDGTGTFDIIDPATDVKIAENPSAGSRTVEALVVDL